MGVNDLMRKSGFSADSASIRMTYDFLVAVFASATTLLGIYSIALPPARIAFLAAPLILVILNYAVGLYTRLRSESGGRKSLFIGMHVLILAAAIVYSGMPVGVAILWAAIALPPLILPRIFFGRGAESRNTLVAKAIRNKGPILIVGGAGYIGTHLVAQLLKENKRVRVLDKLVYGIEPIRGFMENPLFELVEGDATDISKLFYSLDGASAVVHLAGLVGDPACAVDDEFTRHANVIATRMIKDAARSVGIERFVFASSCSVYGAAEEVVDETSDLNPVSLYAMTKIDGENELLRSTDDPDFHVTILRFATVFGHSRRPRFDLVANLFTAQAMTEGRFTVIGPNQWRPFIHVRDIARAVALVLNAKPELVKNQIFNVGDENLNMTIGRLGDVVRNSVQVYHPVEKLVSEGFGDRRNYNVSFRKIKDTLGFTASMTMEAGIAEMVEGFKREAYRNYRDKEYSNLEMTRISVNEFRDPESMARLYRPLAERGTAKEQTVSKRTAPELVYESVSRKAARA